MKGKYIIVKEDFSDYMKDSEGNLRFYDTLEETYDICGMYEFTKVLILKIEDKYNERRTNYI